MIRYNTKLNALSQSGWDVRLRSSPKRLPDLIKLRYKWIPPDIEAFVEETEAVVSPDSKAWFLTSTDFHAENGAAFAWNQWELMSLEAAGSDELLQTIIHTFWDQHFPLVLSVKSGYAYFALNRQHMTIVRGEEPEFEETDVVADSFAELLEQIRFNDRQLTRWI